ncbi:MAG: TraB/GumN family protein [Syntrophotaleaceae bacterium]
MKQLMLIMIWLLALCGSAAAQSSVWLVKQGDSRTYLGGTCHVLRQSDYPLPAEFERAYQAVERVVFEADPGQLNSPRMLQLLATRAFLADGVTLQQLLQPATYRLLQDHCRRNGLQPEAFSRLRPAMAALTLLTMELQRQGIDQGGVDLHFYQRATDDGKAVAALETIDQQIEFMVAMAEGREDRFLMYSLAELERLDEIFNSLIAAWRSGDGAEIARLANADFKRQFPEIYRTLFTERNAAWLPLIEGYLATAEPELVLVGVAHLVGEDGLVAELRRRGYQVELLD